MFFVEVLCIQLCEKEVSLLEWKEYKTDNWTFDFHLVGTTDLYPPARITDLRASNVDIDKMQITLNFTATGDDLMTGKGKCTELKSLKQGAYNV